MRPSRICSKARRFAGRVGEVESLLPVSCSISRRARLPRSTASASPASSSASGSTSPFRPTSPTAALRHAARQRDEARVALAASQGVEDVQRDPQLRLVLDLGQQLGEEDAGERRGAGAGREAGEGRARLAARRHEQHPGVMGRAMPRPSGRGVVLAFGDAAHRSRAAPLLVKRRCTPHAPRHGLRPHAFPPRPLLHLVSFAQPLPALHRSSLAGSPAGRPAKSSNFEILLRKRTSTTPVGPLRCLAMMIWALPSG